VIVNARWDAGDLGCGELIVKLRGRMARLEPGSLFELVARDPGVPEDLPAWCRLTGHELISSKPPHYVIKRVHSRGLRPEIVRPRAAWRAAWPVAASHAPGADSPPARPGWRAARLVARVCRPGRW
jgi:tRNA 2-thiouridine synthesizing protein A